MKTRERPRGQALVEFALVIPIFVLLLVGIFAFGRAIGVNATLSPAARGAARSPIVQGGPPPSASPPPGPPAQGSAPPGRGCPPYPNGTAYPAGSKQAI